MIPENDMRALSRKLDALGGGAHEYVVDRVLKDAPASRTEVVHDAAAPDTPLVRKTFDADAGLGRAYELVMRAQREGGALGCLPRIAECTVAGGTICVVREYVEGSTLEERVRTCGPSAALAEKVVPGLCEAVAELHGLPGGPVIHRDIKPSNVMVEEDGRVVLIDLGIARVYREGAERDTVRFGTPGFAPPEQFGYGQTSCTSDIYALGMVLYFCLTGKMPTAAAREAGFREEGVSAALARVIAKATSFDPKQRFTSADTMRTAFEGALRAGESADEDAARKASGEEPSRPHEAGFGTGKRLRAQYRTFRIPSAHWRAWLMGKLPKPLIVAWDVTLAAFWLLCAYAAVYSIADPLADGQALPMWYRVVEYVGFLCIGAALVLFPFVYKPHLRIRWSRLARTPWWKELLFCWGSALVLALLITVLYTWAVPSGV